MRLQHRRAGAAGSAGAAHPAGAGGDNLAGHNSEEIVTWCLERGIRLSNTLIGGSSLNMAVHWIQVRRALAGQHPQSGAGVGTCAGQGPVGMPSGIGHLQTAAHPTTLPSLHIGPELERQHS